MLLAVLKHVLDERQRDLLRSEIRSRFRKTLQPSVIHFLTGWAALPISELGLAALRRLSTEL